MSYSETVGAHPIALRPLAVGDDAALLAIQRATSGAAHWSAAMLSHQLRDPARGRGANVVVAERSGEIGGAAGWVAAGREFFGSPVLALDEAEIAHKRAALTLYASEHANLRHVGDARESFRPLAAYNYGEAPHPGVLFHARFRYVWGHPRVDRTPPAAVREAIATLLQQTEPR